MSDDPLLYCPECNEASLKKLISAAAFHLKGTGWYETDFKSDKQKNLAKSDSSEKGSGPGKSDKKESKASDKGAAA